MLGPKEDWPEHSSEWALRLGNELNYVVDNISEVGVEKLVPLVEKALEVKPWLVFEPPPEGPCNDIDIYFLKCTRHNFKQISELIKNYHNNPELAARLAGEQAETQAQFRPEGPGAKLPYNVRQLSDRGGDGGNSVSYLLRQLARLGHTEILERYKRKEISARQAAMEAGIIKPRASIPSDITIEDFATQISRRYSTEDLAKLIELLRKPK